MNNEYVIDGIYKTISLNYITRQIQVNNNSSYTVYVNDSGSYPTVTSYKFIIPPNSVYVSTRIGTQSFSFYSPNYTAGDSPVRVTCFDSSDLPPTTLLNPTDQFIQLPNYPYRVLAANGTPQTLPTISILRMQDLYFIASPDTISDIFFKCFMISYTGGGGQVVNLGSLSAFKNHLRYSPNFIPQSITPTLTFWSNPLAQDFWLSAIQTNFILSNSQKGTTSQTQLNQFVTQGFYHASGEKGFIFSLPRFTNPYNVSVNLQVDYGAGSGGAQSILSGTFTGTTAPYVIPPKIFYTPFPTSIAVTITNNIVTPFIAQCQFYAI